MAAAQKAHTVPPKALCRREEARLDPCCRQPQRIGDVRDMCAKPLQLAGQLVEHRAGFLVAHGPAAGVTFGTPGVDITGNLPSSQLTNFVYEGDPVGNYGTDGADPLGNFVTSPDIAHYGGVTLIGAIDAGASAAQTNLSTTAANFFDPASADYKISVRR